MKNIFKNLLMAALVLLLATPISYANLDNDGFTGAIAVVIEESEYNNLEIELGKGNLEENIAQITEIYVDAKDEREIENKLKKVDNARKILEKAEITVDGEVVDTSFVP